MAASKKDVAKQQVKEDREKVREMYLSGKTVKEIAKETYFSSSYCYAMVRDLAKEKNLAKKAKRAPLNEAMIQDAKAGMTVAEIAKKHGVTYQQCYYTVSEYAQTTIKKNKKKQSAATKVRNAAMLEDAKAGMTDKEIAKKYFLSRSSVRTILVGYLHTSNTKKRNERREAILADYEAGMSSKDICKKHGISASTLYKDMRQIGRTSQEYYHKALKIRPIKGIPIFEAKSKEGSRSALLPRNTESLKRRFMKPFIRKLSELEFYRNAAVREKTRNVMH